MLLKILYNVLWDIIRMQAQHHAQDVRQVIDAQRLQQEFYAQLEIIVLQAQLSPFYVPLVILALVLQLLQLFVQKASTEIWHSLLVLAVP
jgi:hypothetical protein